MEEIQIKEGFPQPKPIRETKAKYFLDESTVKAGFDLGKGRCTLVGENGKALYGYRGDDFAIKDL